VSPERGHVRRLIAEGVVIVASILLAFGLDAWWDATQQSQETADLLAALDEEFALAVEELEGTLFGHRMVVESADTILGRLRAGEGRVPAGWLYWVLDAPTSDLNQGTLAALIASGRFEQVPSQQLRTHLAAWPAAVEDFQEEEAEARDFVRRELMPYLSEVVEIGTALRAGRLNRPDATGDVAVPVSPRLINLIEIRRFLAQRVITERGQADIDVRLDQIRRELQTHMR
jgi:hypothetical protein